MIVTHQGATAPMLLPDILRRRAQIPVDAAEHGQLLEPDHVYVGPPGQQLGILGGKLQMVPLAGGHAPIDFLFRSMAAELDQAAIGVVLSGTATDGTLGLKAIQAAGGLTLAQSPESAQYGGMPESAIRAGAVDWIGAPAELAGRLVRHLGQPSAAGSRAGDAALTPSAQDALGRVGVVVRAHTGHDFSQYKPSTLWRRLDRRMRVHQVQDPLTYVRLLQERPGEIDVLLRELLIGVTSFFRDAHAFEALARQAIPRIVAERTDGKPIRVWVPGCSTGEEAYSIAILLYEELERAAKRVPLQIFATDLDPHAIQTARTGRYPEGITSDVSADRLARFFIKEESVFRVAREVREGVVFSQHNLAQDPPFTRIDLVSCRNVLIYFEPTLQARVLPLFHYALVPGGWLLLGPSETVRGFEELFHPVDRKARLFSRQASKRLPPSLPSTPAVRASVPPTPRPPPAPTPGMAELAQRALIDRFALPSVIVNRRGEVVYYAHGELGDYVEPPAGRPTTQLVELVREGIRLELSAALRQAAGQDAEVVRTHLEIRRRGRGRSPLRANLRVRRIADPEALKGLLLVSFEPVANAKQKQPAARATPVRRVAALEEELAHTRLTLQTTVEELEATNEDLKSSNEELQSTNEELQSSNEELETTKEEMQSLNEELQTLNVQLQTKLDDLSQANDDLANLFDATEIATVFLDRNLCVRRFTPAVRKVIRLIDSDLGRPIGDLATDLDYRGLLEDAQQVLRTLVPRRVEVRALGGTFYVVHVLPYRTGEDRIDGLVLTFVDVTEIKEGNLLQEAIVQTVRGGLLVLGGDLRVVEVNPGFCRMFGVTAAETIGKLAYQLGNGQWDIPRLRELLEEVLPKQTTLEDFRVDHVFEHVGRRVMLLNARRLEARTRGPACILVAIEDITDRHA